MRTEGAYRGGVYLLGVMVSVAGMMTACGLCTSHAGQIIFPCVGEIRTDRVNLRAGRSLNYEILAQRDRGARVTVCGLVGGWYRILPPRNVAFWVSSRAVASGKVLAGRLNVRARPSTRSTAVCQLSRGERVQEIEKRGEWTSIKAPRGARLWVSSELVELLPDEKMTEKPDESTGGRQEEEDIEEQPVASAPPEVEEEKVEEQPVASAPPGVEEEKVEEQAVASAPPEVEEEKVEEQAVASAPPGVEGAVIEGQPGAPPTVRLEPVRIPRAYEGRIVRSEQVVISGAEHNLVTGFLRRRVICLLKSRSIDLSYYEGDKVKVWGYETARLPSGIPLLDVRRLEVR